MTSTKCQLLSIFCKTPSFKKLVTAPVTTPMGKKGVEQRKQPSSGVRNIESNPRIFRGFRPCLGRVFFNPSPSMLPLTLLQTSFQIFQEKKINRYRHRADRLRKKTKNYPGNQAHNCERFLKTRKVERFLAQSDGAASSVKQPLVFVCKHH